MEKIVNCYRIDMLSYSGYVEHPIVYETENNNFFVDRFGGNNFNLVRGEKIIFCQDQKNEIYIFGMFKDLQKQKDGYLFSVDLKNWVPLPETVILEGKYVDYDLLFSILKRKEMD